MWVDQDGQNDDNEDAEFDKNFAEFAAKRAAPDGEEPDEPASEAAAPDPDASAPAPAQGDGETPSEIPAGAPAPAVQAPDPWENAPPELRDEYRKAMAELETVRHQALSDRNRVAALSRKLSTLAPTPPPAQPDGAKAALDEKLAKLREDLPEAEPLIEALQAHRDELASVRQATEQVSADRQEAIVAQEMRALQAMHPDFQQIAVDPRWEEWKQAQPDNIQHLAESWDARETSVALTLFKTDLAMATAGAQPAPNGAANGQTNGAQPAPDAATDAKRQQQLDGGADIRSRSVSAASGPPEDFDAAFEYFRRKREKQHRALGQ